MVKQQSSNTNCVTHCQGRANNDIQQDIIRVIGKILEEELVIDDQRCQGMVGIVAIEIFGYGRLIWGILEIRTLSGVVWAFVNLANCEMRRFVFSQKLDEKVFFVGLIDYSIFWRFAAQAEGPAGGRPTSRRKSNDIHLEAHDVSASGV